MEVENPGHSHYAPRRCPIPVRVRIGWRKRLRLVFLNLSIIFVLSIVLLFLLFRYRSMAAGWCLWYLPVVSLGAFRRGVVVFGPLCASFCALPGGGKICFFSI